MLLSDQSVVVVARDVGRRTHPMLLCLRVRLKRYLQAELLPSDQLEKNRAPRALRACRKYRNL
jgi:hypothetical protein